MNSSTDHGSFPIRPFCDRRRSAKEKEADGARQHGSHENTQLGLLPQQGETKASSCTNSDLVKPTPARKAAPTRWLQVSTGPMRAQANEDPAGEQDPQRLAQQQAQTYAQGDRRARAAPMSSGSPPLALAMARCGITPNITRGWSLCSKRWSGVSAFSLASSIFSITCNCSSVSVGSSFGFSAANSRTYLVMRLM